MRAYVSVCPYHIPSVAGRLARTMASRLPPLGVTYAAQGVVSWNLGEERALVVPRTIPEASGPKTRRGKKRGKISPSVKRNATSAAVLTQKRKATALHEPERRSAWKAPTTSRRSRMRTRRVAQLAITLALVSCAAPCPSPKFAAPSHGTQQALPAHRLTPFPMSLHPPPSRNTAGEIRIWDTEKAIQAKGMYSQRPSR